MEKRVEQASVLGAGIVAHYSEVALVLRTGSAGTQHSSGAVEFRLGSAENETRDVEAESKQEERELLGGSATSRQRHREPLVVQAVRVSTRAGPWRQMSRWTSD